MLTIKCALRNITGTWRDPAGYAEPSIKHIHLKDPGSLPICDGMVTTVFTDANALVVWRGRTDYFYPNFLVILQAVGPSLKTIRFNITEKIESPWDYERKRRKVPLERTEDLAAYRFEISSVEGMMANWSRQQYSLWESFYRRRSKGHVHTGEAP